MNYAVGKNASMVCKKKNKNSPFIREGRKSEDELKRAQERLPSLSDSSVDEVLYRALSMSSVSLFTCPDSGITAVTARHSAASATRAQKQKTNKRERRGGKKRTLLEVTSEVEYLPHAEEEQGGKGEVEEIGDAFVGRF